ncbi:MAG: AI-2E family transporter [Sphingomonas sp.]
MPERGDVVIVTPPGSDTDYIKRVIGLPGDRVAVVGGCSTSTAPGAARGGGLSAGPGRRQHIVRAEPLSGRFAMGADGRGYCRLPIYRETLPGRALLRRSTWGPRASPGDDYPERRVPKGQVFLMGDNRDNSRRQAATASPATGLGGPVPWENIGGRAEFITFSLDGSAGWNPLTLVRLVPPRPRRHLAPRGAGAAVSADADSGAVSVVQEPGPNELRDPVMRAEIRKAAVWLGMAAAIALLVLLIQPLLLIFGALVFASMLDGGVRLLGRVLPIPRGLRLAIVVVLVIAFIAAVFYLTRRPDRAAGRAIARHAQVQANRVGGWSRASGWCPSAPTWPGWRSRRWDRSGGSPRRWAACSAPSAACLMVMTIGLFIAIEPRLYERGLQWMVPVASRDEFAVTIARMARTLRMLLAGRLAGMLFEGVLTWILLSIAGVPMALLLGIITGILAFVPNIGAFVSGVLMVSVGFSAGPDQGLWAIAVYFGVQTFDGYVLIPLVAKRTVDLPPALTLSAQILASTLFGVIGPGASPIRWWR